MDLIYLLKRFWRLIIHLVPGCYLRPRITHACKHLLAVVTEEGRKICNKQIHLSPRAQNATHTFGQHTAHNTNLWANLIYSRCLHTKICVRLINKSALVSADRWRRGEREANFCGVTQRACLPRLVAPAGAMRAARLITADLCCWLALERLCTLPVFFLCCYCAAAIYKHDEVIIIASRARSWWWIADKATNNAPSCRSAATANCHKCAPPPRRPILHFSARAASERAIISSNVCAPRCVIRCRALLFRIIDVPLLWAACSTCS